MHKLQRTKLTRDQVRKPIAVFTLAWPERDVTVDAPIRRVLNRSVEGQEVSIVARGDTPGVLTFGGRREAAHTTGRGDARTVLGSLGSCIAPIRL